jgi:hypothetical protein
MQKPLSPIFWLWIPIVALVIQILLEIFIPKETLSIMHSENGPHETLQALTVAVGFFVSIRVLCSKTLKTWLLKVWFTLAALACLYVTGEEVSWGQHIWDWTTPEFWQGINDQEETNLHNTSSWLDQKPRLILLVGIVFGTLIYPFLKKKNFIKLPVQLDFLFPPKELSIIALIIVVSLVIEKIFEIFDIFVFVRYSEV